MPLERIDPLLLSIHHAHPGNSSTRRQSYGIRTVREFELDLMLGGDGEIVLDGVSYPTLPGTLFFRYPGMVVEGITPYSCYYVRFLPFDGTAGTSGPEGVLGLQDPQVLDDWLEQLPFPPVMKIRDAIGMTRLFSDLHKARYRTGPTGAMSCRILLMQILLSIYEECIRAGCPSTTKVDPVIASRIQQAAAWLEANPRLPRTLASLALMAGYSRYAFCRRFKEVLGESPMAYGNRMRVKSAERMIVDTSDSISAIIPRCGFASEENFYRQFRKHAGTSPQAYRILNTGRAS
jgi:AraC-like DNA-binding protein